MLRNILSYLLFLNVYLTQKNTGFQGNIILLNDDKTSLFIQAVSAVFVSVFFRSQLGVSCHPGTRVLNPELPNRCPPETPRFSGVPTRASAKTWLQLKQFYHPRNSREIHGNTTNWKNCQASTKTLIFSFLFTTEIEVFLVFFFV